MTIHSAVQSSKWDVLDFGCFAPGGFQHFHCIAMRKAIKVHKNWKTIQQNEHTGSTNHSVFLFTDT